MSRTEISYIVQSVPERRQLRERLLASIPPAVIVEDDGPPPPNPWRGYQLCLRSFLASTATHAVVIQDDALVCKNFGSAVGRVVEARGEVPICLFVSGVKTATLKHYRKAMLANERYATVWFQDFLPVVAVIWPREKASRFLEWAADAKLPGMPNPRSDDAVCGSWMKFTRQTVLATVPSLVEHPDDCVSHSRDRFWNGLDKTRIAAYWINDVDPLTLDWA